LFFEFKRATIFTKVKITDIGNKNYEMLTIYICIE
jgi:hypothetical protein